MKLVVILGPPAVGKMTVGQVLSEITGLKLHNHMIAELLWQIFPLGQYSEDMWRLKDLFTKEIFETIVKSDLPGLIYTNMLNFDLPDSCAYIQNILDLYKSHGAETCVVELCADLNVRVERNKTENRLFHKPSKRDIKTSENRLFDSEERKRLNTLDGELPFANYLKIDNTHLTPHDVALKIKSTFFI